MAPLYSPERLMPPRLRLLACLSPSPSIVPNVAPLRSHTRSHPSPYSTHSPTSAHQVFVGVAYRVGVVLKASFYSCQTLAEVDAAASGSAEWLGSAASASASVSASASASGSASASVSPSASASGSGSASGSAAAHTLRMLGASASGSGGALPECVYLNVGVLHALAPFLGLYVLWSIETAYRARFEAASRAHQARAAAAERRSTAHSSRSLLLLL